MSYPFVVTLPTKFNPDHQQRIADILKYIRYAAGLRHLESGEIDCTVGLGFYKTRR